MDILIDVTDDNGFIPPWDGDDYPTLRTVPDNEITMNDYKSTEEWPGFPAVPLIDLKTMKVVRLDCWPPSDWPAIIESYL